MKKKLLALLGASVLMLSSCFGSTKLEDVKKLYEGETYSEWYRARMSETEEDVTWVGDANEQTSLLNTYVTPIKEYLADNFAFFAYTSQELYSTVYNFNSICDAEVTAAAKYGEEFTYEIKGTDVTATLTTSRTIGETTEEVSISREDIQLNNSIGYAFSYIVKYGDIDEDHRGLPLEISIVLAVVKENAKEKVVASYLSTVTRTIQWDEYR